MGSCASTHQSAAIDLSQYRIDTSIRNLAMICPECYKTGVYYYDSDRSHQDYCHGLDSKLCSFHFRQKQLKNII